jgi:hypothetical protein
MLVKLYETPDVVTVYALPAEIPLCTRAIVEILFEAKRDVPTGKMFSGRKLVTFTVGEAGL